MMSDDNYTARLLHLSIFMVVILVTSMVSGGESDPKDSNTKEHSAIISKIMNVFEIGALRPNTGTHAVNVTCEMYVNSIHSVKEVNMEYSVAIYLKMRWHDERLRHNGTEPITLNSPEFIDVVWRPDVYFDNEKKGEYHKVTTDNRALELGSEGDITYGLRNCFQATYPKAIDRRITLFGRPMGMRIPVPVKDAYDANNLILQWRDFNPVALFPDNQMPQFTLTKYDYTESIRTYKHMPNKSCLEVVFYLEREMGYYILTNYIPSALLVILSWVSFWLHLDATAARVALGITTVLTTATQLSIARESLPEVSYPTAIDVWMTSCMFFVFGAMIEFAIVNYLYMYRKSKINEHVSGIEPQELTQKTNFGNNADGLNDGNFTTHVPVKDVDSTRPFIEKPAVQTCSYARMAKKVDRLARLLFPLLYGVFNGQMFGICGSVDSGKQSLISAILSQLRLITGKVAIDGRMAYNLTSEGPVVTENRPSDNWPHAGAIELQELKLRFRENLPLALRGVSCKVESMQTIRIVGRTGAGKTSLGACLFRLRELNSGAIYNDGINIASPVLQDLKSKLTIIAQDPVLYNLDPFQQYSDDEVCSALEKCYMKDTIVMLDEATASTDTATDSLLQQTIRDAFQDCTMLIIAHRLNTVLNCDKIMVMDKGKAVKLEQEKVKLERKKAAEDIKLEQKRLDQLAEIELAKLKADREAVTKLAQLDLPRPDQNCGWKRDIRGVAFSGQLTGKALAVHYALFVDETRDCDVVKCVMLKA
uniref:Glycine receptor subunit alpha-3-like n=1 Tax=Saccoglossus kowalevskii TaxID=10224 RepID=A0ABM0LYF4_SACKO|nr:PREDICTED: glycine receptor subunit alpha-3-like [Saccoglossus kowalevskii]